MIRATFSPSGCPFPGEFFRIGRRDCQYQRALQERLRLIHGVVEASVDQALPTDGGFQMEYALPSEKFGPDMDAKMPHADFEFVDSHFLNALRIPILTGRAFTQDEYDLGSPVALINRTFARRLFGPLDYDWAARFAYHR